MILSIILGIMFGGGGLGLMLGCVAMVMSGRIALPGTESARLKRAKVDLEISEISMQTQEMRFRAAQHEANHDLMMAKHHADMEVVFDSKFAKALGKGED